MPPFGPIQRLDLIRNFKKLGFEGPYAGGKHQYMIQGQPFGVDSQSTPRRYRQKSINQDIESGQHYQRGMGKSLKATAILFRKSCWN